MQTLAGLRHLRAGLGLGLGGFSFSTMWAPGATRRKPQGPLGPYHVTLPLLSYPVIHPRQPYSLWGGG